ncbi:helix-turn-helix domain-containing protein [Priestia megaterium]|uniref:helix-turn-helix domain-containing protein n=1 Tax=Priestia megaterium TaxID=1404 RepID=UPI00367224EF
MEKIQGIISNNLRKIRKKRRLSLDDLSIITGVSKSLLRQIEKEESNPTITTIWKIADGLKIPFTSLMEYEMPEAEIIRKESIEPLLEDEGLYRLFPHFNFEDQKPFEMYTVEMKPLASLKSTPHNSGAIECIIVFSGVLCLTINEKEYILHTGDSVKFKADNQHSYSNFSDELTKLSMVIYYPYS